MPRGTKRSSPGTGAPSGDVVLGRIAGVFGLGGEVRLFVYNPGSDLLDEPLDVRLVPPSGSPRPARLSTRPGAGRRILGRIEGVDTPEAAANLVGWSVVIAREVLPVAEPGTWYLHDVLERPVRTSSGRDLGRLVAVHQGGAVDVWEMDGPEGLAWLPLLEGRVVSVGPEGIVVTDEGLVTA
jgi:16S rRNA processing protein RimM